MTPEAYRGYTLALKEQLLRDQRVVSLVAVGSMAGRESHPDRWSDHDFFVVVKDGEQTAFREELDWLPQFDAVVLPFQETRHGLKVLYEGGHLVEFGIFGLKDLHLARLNRFKVLFDRKNIERRLGIISTTTLYQSRAAIANDDELFGQFLTKLLVGVGHYYRGEHLSGRATVQTEALRHLLQLFEKHLPAARRPLLDSLDPLRRFEVVFPKLGRDLDKIMGLPVPRSALEMLDLAERELKVHVHAFPKRALEVVKSRLEAEAFRGYSGQAAPSAGSRKGGSPL